MLPEQKKRWRFALRLSLIHAGINIITAVGVMVLVFGVWFPYPYYRMLGGLGLLGLIVLVDVVCGPILTAVLANPAKSKRELALDLSLVGIIQLAALLYGLYAVALARPVAVAFETDRFYTATRAEIDDERLTKAPESLRELSWFGVRRIALRPPKDGNEKMDSIALSLQGIPPAVRPDWWLPENDAERAKIREKMRPVSELAAKYPDNPLLQKAVAETGLAQQDVFYLPFTAGKDRDWTVLLNKNTDFVGFVPLDAF